MKYKDLREFVAFLEGKGDLKRITAPVSCELEITEIADRMVKSGGPALLFENVEGYDVPVLINMYGTQQRMAWALGVEHLDDLVGRLERLMSMAQQPPKGMVDKMRALGQLARLASFQPKVVSQCTMPRGGADRRRCGLVQPAHPQVLADGRGALHHTATGRDA